MIITDVKKCLNDEKCREVSKNNLPICIEVCPTNATIMLDGKSYSCITCGACARECPNKAIKKNEFGGYYVDRKKCNGCGTCEVICPINIIKIKKEEKIIGNRKREVAYPEGICVMCGLCVETCPHNGRMFFDLRDLKDKKNRALADRYLQIFNKNKEKKGSLSLQEKREEESISNRTLEVRVSININRDLCRDCGKCIYLCPRNSILEKDEVDGCTKCNLCGEACPVDAIINGNVDDTKCVLCGNCIDKCPKDVLKIENFKVSKVKEDREIIPLRYCINCGLCADKCPKGALQIKDNRILYDPNLCNMCGTCIKVCPQGVRVKRGEKVDGGCVLCGICMESCPENAISIKEIEKFQSIKDKNCIFCGTCSNVCPVDAITVKILKFKGNNKNESNSIGEILFNENCIMCENCAIHCPRDVIPNTTGYK
ncbi:MAG TPA: 4Fe-4S dicluster domain-containing protein, partial [Candidatus Nanopusillus sp.]|nr:4Fe-4S dicluster domain-containing protein [Candidatus Nanopusillus sp.]